MNFPIPPFPAPRAPRPLLSNDEGFPISTISALHAPRPSLSKDEVSVVMALRHALKATDSTFCCTGHVPLDVKRPVIFYATTPAIFAITEEKPDGTTISTAALDLSSATADYSAFHDACLPAAFGHGKELVYDETYRLAREIRPEAFGLNFDPIGPSNGILSEISRLLDISIRAELYKINSYGQGGMFRAHQDTPRSDGHIGTLVIAFPIPFEGGEFILRKSGGQTVLDWSTVGRAAHPDELHWVFFYSDIEHEILPVKSGYRVTISYNIYGVTPTTTSSQAPSLVPATGNGIEFKFNLTPIFSNFVEAYKNPAFLPQGGRLAFGLDHEYGLGGKPDSVTNIDGLYKGIDAALVSTLLEMGLTYSFKAVYQVPKPWEWENYAPDEFSTIAGGDMFLIWDSFVGAEPYDEPLAQALGQQGAEADHSLVWIQYPTKFTEACNYIGYGNEPSLETVYVAAAVIVKIPAFGTPMRTVTSS